MAGPARHGLACLPLHHAPAHRPMKTSRAGPIKSLPAKQSACQFHPTVEPVVDSEHQFAIGLLAPVRAMHLDANAIRREELHWRKGPARLAVALVEVDLSRLREARLLKGLGDHILRITPAGP